VQTPELLRQVPIFNGLDEQIIDHFCAHTNQRQIKKGTMICAPDDVAHNFYIVQSGWVKLFRDTQDGQEAVLDILSTFGIFGENSLFGKSDYGWYAEAVEDTTLLSIPVSILKEAIKNHQTVAVNMITAMSEHRRKLDGEIERFMLQNAPQRVGCFLLKLVPQSAWDNEVACPPINLPYNKALVATRLGMTPETFSRALKALKKNTDITVKQSTIHIENVDSLASYSCQACSNFFPCDTEDEDFD
jgi:CRP-like cAMP-binding protein